MNFSISHIEVDFLVWTTFSNFMFLLIFLVLFFCIGATFFGYLKFSKGIRKRKKRILSDKINGHFKSDAIEQREFDEFFPMPFKLRIKKDMGNFPILIKMD